MANYFLCMAIFRVILPLLVLVCVVFRPSLLSAIYLLLLLYMPFVPVPTVKSMKGCTGRYIKLLIAVSTMGLFAQMGFQIWLLGTPPYGKILKRCKFKEELFRHLGFVKFDELPISDIMTWLSPEVLMFASSTVTYMVCSKLVVGKYFEDIVQAKAAKKKRRYAMLVSLGRYVALASLCLAAVLQPSLQGAVYFLCFLLCSTWWACYKKLEKGFAIALRCLLVLIFVHIGVYYGYQLQYSQRILDSNSTYARYFGLVPLLKVTCEKPREFIFLDADLPTYLNPLALIWLFHILVITSKQFMKPSLIRGVSPNKKYGTGRTGILQDSTGSVTVTGDNQDDIQMQQLGTGTTEEEYRASIFEHIIYLIEGIIQFIIKTSYIGTNIIMMTWSITYLSWLTFVLLLWANILWFIPNQRQAMLRCSPLLVMYAWFLLISAYIYSMNLTKDELPSVIKGINLAEIGFQKVLVRPCNPLIVKCLYTVMFWVTLRQYMQERKEAKQSSALADMVAPLQVTVGTATGVSKEQEKSSKIMDIMAAFTKNFLTKFWIWIVAITLFGVAITGQRMTGFRIVYMALFLFFIISFQLSFKMWRKIMYTFWLVVILYSMVILILTYTYQFENFPNYWTKYLFVPVQQQWDIGLEKYETKQLFVRLVTPTFFVIITAVQLHYFHKDFMELSNPRNKSTIEIHSESSSVQAVTERDTTTTESKYDVPDFTTISKADLKAFAKKFVKKWHYFVHYTYMFLEIHMPKFVFLSAIMVCVYDECALYLPVIILMICGMLLGRTVLNFAIYTSSTFASLLLLARMVYQIQYMKHDIWNVTCEVTVNNKTINRTDNSAEWLGFKKSNNQKTFIDLVWWNVFYILVVTFYSIIIIRQFNYKVSRGLALVRPFIMFPKIKVADSNKDLISCLKYLANYCFFRFGVEISLMATVALIGIRMDICSVLYSLWLLLLVNLKRSTLSKIWGFYFIFIAILIPLQYCMVIGLPPFACADYPWDTSYHWRKFQEWAFLIGSVNKPVAEKLICDCILLIFVQRQLLVFRIEKRYGPDYGGGSNESIIHHAEEEGFVNPVPDYITYVRSYLDIIKRGLLLSFLWITLAIAFLAGTNRVNLFSIGYLIGAFIFLWQGSDLYLRPIPKILESWNMLLGYNVLVIFAKSCLQLAGCVFIDYISSVSCWPIQLLGIGCVRKFDLVLRASYNNKDDDMEYCTVPSDSVGLVWDGLVFGFVIMQKRLFQSYNFFHMVDETKATTILASRGAELIEELRQKRVAEQEEQERKILEKIKVKMDRIKANQQKIEGPEYKDTSNHFIDAIFKSRPRYRRRAPKSYREAIRSGDYYMFDEMDDEELDLIEETISKDEDDDEDKATKPLTMSEITKRTSPKPKTPEPKPSTSRDEEISDLSEPEEQSVAQKILFYLLFVWVFLQSMMISLTNFLNKYSKDYRYVIRVLTKEKKILKEKTNYHIGVRIGTGQMWHPSGSYHSILRMSSAMQPDIKEFDVTEMSSHDQPPFIKLLLSIWFIIFSHSDIMCHFMVFLNQIKSATFLSLPLPFMVFLWGTLTVPRPSKTFWVTIIAYTEVIVLIKCMFQFEIIPWNKEQGISNYPFYPPRIIGIERAKNYAIWDLLLLLVVFFHRFMLKCLGLWKSSYVVPAVLQEGDYLYRDGTLRTMDGEEIVATKHSGSLVEDSDIQQLVSEDEGEQDPNKKPEGVEDDGDYAEEDVERIVKVTKDEVEPCDSMPESLEAILRKYAESMHIFFLQLLDPTSRVSADVYSYMFLCDFFNFFVILIGYSSFGTQQGDGGVSSYLEDNRVPVLFLLMLILQFLLILIDRAIFLRRFILGKVIFQYLQIILLHIWLFILFPAMTERQFNSVLPPQMYYMVKCFYLLLSAYQIRCGYPTRILGNFLCKGYNYFNLFMFKGFMAIPFLFELRTVMDWMWTDTSMTVFDWIKMEDIFAHIFELKCVRYVDNQFPQPRGEKKSSIVKYFQGGLILFFLIGVIWFPLVFFSLGNAVGRPNVPYDVTVELKIGPYEPIYHISAQTNSIFQFSEPDLIRLNNEVRRNKVAATFLSNYEALDVAAVKLSTDSAIIWSISPPDKKRMIEEINSTKPITIRYMYVVSHKSNTKEDPGMIHEEVEITVPAEVNGKRNPTRINLLDMLLGSDSAPPVMIEYILPKFLKVTNRGTAKPVSNFMPPVPDEKASFFRNISLKLEHAGGVPGEETFKEWWEIHEDCNDETYNDTLSVIPYADCNSIIIYTFNDKIFPATLSIITAGGIIGLYTTLVFVASRVLRGFFSEICFKIMFEDMPNVDRVLQLCLDIYLVREAREFCLEEDLFAKLLFLFRSPETLIKWTRPKEEIGDDDPEGDPNN